MNFNLTLIGQSLAFIFFVWFTLKFVWPLLLGKMAEREKRIADGLAAADEGQLKFTQAGQLFQEKLNEGKQQAAAIVAQAHKRGDEMVEEAKTTARVEGNRIIESARHEIAREREQVREQLKQQVAALALAGAEQILMREVDRKAHDELLGKISAGL